MPKKYEVEFVSITRETYVAEVEVPDHIADDDLRSYLRGEVENTQEIRSTVIDLTDQEPVTTILTHYERLQDPVCCGGPMKPVFEKSCRNWVCDVCGAASA